MTDERKFTPPTEYPAEYVTRDGRKARILGEIERKRYQYAAVVTSNDEDTCEILSCYTKDGAASYYDGRWGNLDLFDKPETVTRWVNVYPFGVDMSHESREKCDGYANKNRLNVLRITTCQATGKLIEYVEEGV